MRTFKRTKTAPVVVETSIRPEDIQVVLNDRGQVERYNAKTGELIDEKSLTSMRFELFNKEKAEVLFQTLSSGITLNKSLAAAKVSHQSYLYWRKTNPDFTHMVDRARDLRSEGLHEKFYEDEKDLITASVDALEADELTEHDKRLAVLQKKQKVIGQFKQEDAPTKYGVKYSKKSERFEGSFNFEANVPDEVLRLISKNFTPVLNKEGDVVLPEEE